jgi:hypothetical protein
MLMIVTRRAGLALPSSKRTPNACTVTATAAVRRWRALTLMVAVTAIVCAIAWIAAPRIAHFTLPYEVGLAVVGIASGAILGALIVIGLTWIGLVQRAWRCNPAMSTSVIVSR